MPPYYKEIIIKGTMIQKGKNRVAFVLLKKIIKKSF